MSRLGDRRQPARLTIGMVMFACRYQKVLHGYFAADIDEEKFLKGSHSFCSREFDDCLYRDIIQQAKLHGIFVLVTYPE